MLENQDALPRVSLLIRYGVVGLINTAVHFLTTIALVEIGDFNPVPASVAGFLLAVLVSFLLNSRWTFGQTDRMLERLLKFSAVSIFGMCLNTGVMYLAVETLNMHYLVGLLLVVFIVPPSNFLLNYFWSFRPS